MSWIKARFQENSTWLGMAVLVAMGGGVDLAALQALQGTDVAAIVMALVATVKGDK